LRGRCKRRGEGGELLFADAGVGVAAGVHQREQGLRETIAIAIATAATLASRAPQALQKLGARNGAVLVGVETFREQLLLLRVGPKALQQRLKIFT
jgi:hypothetical protein